MKKILILNTVYSGGGAAKVARQVFDFLNKNEEFDAYFACGRGVNGSDKKIFNFGVFGEKYLHIFLVRLFGIEGFGSYFSTKRLINFIKEGEFDLIHIHNLHGYYLNFFMLVDFLGKSGIPIVWTLHDEWAVTWMPAYSTGCLHCKTAVGECVNFCKYPKTYNKLFTKFMLNKKREYLGRKWKPVIICPSEWLEKEVKNSYLNNCNIKFIINGANIDIFKPSDNKELKEKYNIPSNKKIFLFSISDVNNFIKGYLYINETVKKIKDENILFIGVGNSDIKPAENLRIISYVKDDETLSDIYNLADVFLYTSLVENMPLTVIEAMSCGLPIVAFNILGVRELVDRDTGFLVEPKNISMIIMDLKILLENEDLRKRMAVSAREKAVSHLSLDKTLSEYHVLYKSLLNI